MKRILLSISALAFLYSCATLPETPAALVEKPVERNLYAEHIAGAENGAPDDEVRIGYCYEKGLGVDRDYAAAMDWYQKAASKGNPEAYYRIGSLYEKGLGVDPDRESALEWYYSSAVNSYLPAIESLIDFYEGNEEEQLKWIREGKKAGDPYSTYRYGLIIEPEDRDLAVSCFIRGGESENADARSMYAILSLGGKAPPIDEKKALGDIRESADEGNARSALFMGWLYEFGDMVPADANRALQYYEESARKNNQMALYNLSRFYGEGIGVETDYAKSINFLMQFDGEAPNPSYSDLIDLAEYKGDKDEKTVLYRFRAAGGDLEAQYRLGMMAEGDDAFKWFWESAHEGYVPSMVELARLILDDQPLQAAAWLMVAENRGFHDDSFNSKTLMKDMDRKDKLEVSRIFTELFYQ